jgi:putative phosphoesterase
MNQKDRELRIGIIADTHGWFDRAILRHFQGVDHVLHAGDIGDHSVVRQLKALAPLTVVAGNVDGFEQSGFSSEMIVELGGKRIGLKHILYEGGRITKEGRAFLERERPDVCVFGHTHQPRTEQRDGTLLFNPGSAGPKRFSLPRGLGLLVIRDGVVTPSHILLADRPE